MENNIKPILKRQPDYIILHVGTNNATNVTAPDILDILLRLKSTILDACKTCTVIISQPTLHSDNGKVALTNHYLCNLLEEVNIDIVKNHNTGSKHLGCKGLHFNPHETSRLALNLKATIRTKFGNLGNPGYQSNVTSVSSDHSNYQKLNHCNKKQPEKLIFSFRETKRQKW